LRNRELWDRLHGRIPKPLTHTGAAEQHLTLYRKLLARRTEERDGPPAALPFAPTSLAAAE